MENAVNYAISESVWSLTDHGRKAETKLKSNIYDLEAWSILIREAQVNKLQFCLCVSMKLEACSPLTFGCYFI